jgi:hypothetical protein
MKLLRMAPQAISPVRNTMIDLTFGLLTLSVVGAMFFLW